LHIGNHVSIGDNTHIGAINEIVIGDNVLISARCLITDHSHGDNIREMTKSPTERNLFSKGGCYIENDCWIGEGVVILPGVTIGRGAVIGAGAVVTSNIPKHAIAVGNPARVVRMVYNDTLEENL